MRSNADKSARRLDASVRCEVTAGSASVAANLSRVVRTCAADVGQPLVVRRQVDPEGALQPVLTLHLPAELAVKQDRVWCLACRLACFCPEARVSVLVHGETAFAAPARARQRAS